MPNTKTTFNALNHILKLLESGPKSAEQLKAGLNFSQQNRVTDELFKQYRLGGRITNERGNRGKSKWYLSHKA